jgi:hypothetical protein
MQWFLYLQYLLLLPFFAWATFPNMDPWKSSLPIKDEKLSGAPLNGCDLLWRCLYLKWFRGSYGLPCRPFCHSNMSQFDASDATVNLGKGFFAFCGTKSCMYHVCRYLSLKFKSFGLFWGPVLYI